MSKPSKRDVPPDVYAVLLDYWTKRTAARWTMPTKQNPKESPFDRLCAQLTAVRVAVEQLRDEQVRAKVGASSQERLDELKAALAIRFVNLWFRPRPANADPNDEGAQLIDQWMNTKVWDHIVRYAKLDIDRAKSFADLFLDDECKLSAVAVALKDAEEQARQILPQMARDGQADDKTRDHPTAWLIREWRERFPNVSRGALARWIHQLEIEPGSPEKIEERLRKAEGRRRSSVTKQALSGRTRQLPASASPGRN